MSIDTKGRKLDIRCRCEGGVTEGVFPTFAAERLNDHLNAKPVSIYLRNCQLIA